MMRPPPPPLRRSDPVLPQSSQQPFLPGQYSYPHPPVSQRFPSAYRPPSFPPRPASAIPSQSGLYHPRPQSSFSTRRAGRSDAEKPFFPPTSSQPESTKEEGEVEEEYESYNSQVAKGGGGEGSLAPTESQLFSLSQKQVPHRPFDILIPDSHLPRRVPRPVPSQDIMGDASPPPSSRTHTPFPSQPFHSNTQIPDTRPPTQMAQTDTQQEGAGYLAPPKRVDTYRPEPPSMPVNMGRPANVWQMEDMGTRRAASVMPRPPTRVVASPKKAERALGKEVQAAAGVYMAATQQAGTKTTSEKIMAALSDWSTQILEVIAEVKRDQKQVRDQVHDLQTGQRALATREEVVEEITSQLSPALHEFFQGLHTKLAESLAPLPEDTARLATEKIRTVLAEMKQAENSQKSQEESQNTLTQQPVGKLMDHLISKLDSVSRISEFLQSYKELPEALRDVAVYKQSMDTLMAMTKNGSLCSTAPQNGPSGIDTGSTRRLQEGIDQIVQQLERNSSNVLTSGNDKVLEAITSLAQGLDRLPLQPPAPATALPPVSYHMIQLEAKVDNLATDIGQIKALLLQRQPPQPGFDMTAVINQVKAAMTASAPGTTTATPLTILPADITEYSQLQPTEIGNSQPQDYPTPASRDRSEQFPTILSVTSAVPPPVFGPITTGPSPADDHVTFNRQHNTRSTAQTSTGDVFGRIQPTSALRTPMEASGLGIGNLGVSIAEVEEEDQDPVDAYADLFDDVKPATGKKKGKRASSGPNTGAVKNPKKRARTSTTVMATTASSTVSGTRARCRKASSSTIPIVIDSSASQTPSPNQPVANPTTSSYLNDHDHLKRSDRIFAKRTISDNPIYLTDSMSGTDSKKRRSSATKAVKQELITESTTPGLVPSTGKQHRHPSSLESDSLNSFGYTQPSSRSRVESQLQLPSSDPQTQIPTQDTLVDTDLAQSQSQSQPGYAQKPDPIPLIGKNRYSRTRGFSGILGGDGEDSLSL